MPSRSPIKSIIGLFGVIGYLVLAPFAAGAGEYFDAKNGEDSAPGTSGAPFRTISRAAEVAMPGDTVTVREGIYREWVSPARGGTDEQNRIVYRADEGADVRILGSEPATDWDRVDADLWKIELPADRFDDFNPFATLSRNPRYIEQDESGDGWGWLRYGRWTHLGDVIIGGEGLIERETLEEVRAAPLSWFATVDEGVTTIWANFGDMNPGGYAVELNHRPFGFFPEKVGVNYITMQGFTVMNVASHWAPPVAFQPGAIGTNGGTHWVIENNTVVYAKAVAISIGVPSEPRDPENSGHHIIRNNTIVRAGQAGIAGQSFNQRSVISGNHVEDTNYRKEFGGWETAAIKLHNGDGIVIADNFVRNVSTIDPEIGAAHGIWNDYQNSNWQVDGNIVVGAEGNAVLTEANWEGPNLYSNNILIGGRVGTYSSRGDVWAHNLFVGTPQRWENQPWGDRVPIGDARWIGNVFVGVGLQPGVEAESSIFAHNVYLGGAKPHDDDESAVVNSKEGVGVSLLETDKGIVLRFSPDWPGNVDIPMATSERLDLPFSFDATVAKDFLGEARQNGSNLAGPFARIEDTSDEVLIYRYSAAYEHALKLIQGQ